MELDKERYRPMPARTASEDMQHPPVEQAHLLRSTVMLSSLPAISTSVDGIVRQFYNGRRLPSRRIIVP